MYKEEMKKNYINSRIQSDSPSICLLFTPFIFYFNNAYFIQIINFENFKNTILHTYHIFNYLNSYNI